MLPSFERELTRLHSIAKTETEAIDPESREQARESRKTGVSGATEYFSRDKEAYEAIHELQRQKLGTMQRLKRELQAIQNGEAVEAPKGTRHVTIQDGQLVWIREEPSKDRRGRPILQRFATRVTLTDLLVDLEWGVEYALDPQVPKRLRKQYAVARARHAVETLTDRQLYAKALGDQRMDPLLKDAYRRSLADQENARVPDGILTEKLIASQFRKWCLDHPDLPILFERTDVHQDIEQKVDLCLRVNDWRRGVQVEPVEQVHHPLGVQITTNTTAEAQNSKHRQLDYARRRYRDEYDDIILMTVETNLAHHVRSWERAGKPPGGPLRFWKDEAQKETVFRGCVRQLLQQEESTRAWEEIKARA